MTALWSCRIEWPDSQHLRLSPDLPRPTCDDGIETPQRIVQRAADGHGAANEGRRLMELPPAAATGCICPSGIQRESEVSGHREQATGKGQRDQSAARRRSLPCNL